MQEYRLGMYIILSPEKMMKDKIGDIYTYISSNKPYEIQAKIDEINSNNNEETISGQNLYEDKMAEKSNTSLIMFILGVFIFIVSTFSIINVFYIVSTNIKLRQRDFAILKSIGMDKKSITKMTFWEGVFIGSGSILFGTLIGTIVLYLMYIFLLDIRKDRISIQFNSIIIAIITVMMILFLATVIAKRRVGKGNIIDEMKNENI